MSAPTVATGSLPDGPNGQTLANLVVNPADGSAQTHYDWWLGLSASATSTDPLYGSDANGNAYLEATSINQRCLMKGPVPEWITRMHMANSEWTVALWIRTGTGFGQAGSDGGAQFFTNGLSQVNDACRGLVLNPGRVNGSNGNRVGIQWRNDNSPAVIGQVQMVHTPGENQMTCTIWSYASGQESYILHNSQPLFTFTYTGLVGTMPSGATPTLFSSRSGSSHVGSRLYRLEMLNSRLTPAEMDALYNQHRERFNLPARPA